MVPNSKNTIFEFILELKTINYAYQKIRSPKADSPHSP